MECLKLLRVAPNRRRDDVIDTMAEPMYDAAIGAIC